MKGFLMPAVSESYWCRMKNPLAPRGSRHLDARGLLGRDAVGMLTPEPTGGVIWNANRGAISVRATMRGKAAHVGRQLAGVNASGTFWDPGVGGHVRVLARLHSEQTCPHHPMPAA